MTEYLKKDLSIAQRMNPRMFVDSVLFHCILYIFEQKYISEVLLTINSTIDVIVVNFLIFLYLDPLIQIRIIRA